MVLLLAIAMSVAGLYLARTMNVDVFPDLTAPTVTILTEAHGLECVGPSTAGHGTWFQSLLLRLLRGPVRDRGRDAQCRPAAAAARARRRRRPSPRRPRRPRSARRRRRRRFLEPSTPSTPIVFVFLPGHPFFAARERGVLRA